MLLGMLLLALAFAGIGAWLWALDAHDATHLPRLGPLWLVHTMGALTFALGSMGLWVSAWMLRPSAVLRIGPDGLNDRSHPLSLGHIPWSNVRAIKLQALAEHSVVQVWLHDVPRQLLQCGPLTAAWGWVVWQSGGSPVAVHTWGLRLTAAELAALLARHVAAHQAGNRPSA